MNEAENVAEEVTQDGMTDQQVAEQLEGLLAVEEPQEVDEQDAQAEQNAQEEQEEPEEEAEQEPEELQFETVYQVAEAAGMEPEDFMKAIKAKAKVDGEELEVTLDEAIRGYQREADYTRKLDTVHKTRKSLEAQQQKLEQAHSAVQAIAQIDPMAQEQHLLNEQYKQVDWDELRNLGDGSFADKQMEFQNRQNEINQYRQQYGAAIQSVIQQMTEQAQETRQASIKAGQERLKEMIGRNLTNDDISAVTTVMRDNGVDESVIFSVTDPGLVRMALKLAQSGVAEKATKKTKGRRQVTLRPGNGAQPTGGKKAFNRARELQTDDAWTDAIAERLGL